MIITRRTPWQSREMIGATPGFLRSLDEAKLFVPQRSAGGHRRYTRYQLRLPLGCGS